MAYTFQPPGSGNLPPPPSQGGLGGTLRPPPDNTQSVEQKSLGGGNNPQQVQNFMKALQGVGAGHNNTFQNAPANNPQQTQAAPLFQGVNPGNGSGANVSGYYNPGTGAQQQSPTNNYNPGGQITKVQGTDADGTGVTYGGGVTTSQPTQPPQRQPYIPPPSNPNPPVGSGGSLQPPPPPPQGGSGNSGGSGGLLPGLPAPPVQGPLLPPVPTQGPLLPPPPTQGSLFPTDGSQGSSQGGSTNPFQGYNQSQGNGQSGASNPFQGQVQDPNQLGVGQQQGNLGSGVLVSDENAKTNIESAPTRDLQSFLDNLGAHKYDYKDKADGDKEGYVSPMAQELEKSKLGATMVETRPDGKKQVNYGRGFGIITAAQSLLHDRLTQIEKSLKIKGK